MHCTDEKGSFVSERETLSKDKMESPSSIVGYTVPKKRLIKKV